MKWSVILIAAVFGHPSLAQDLDRYVQDAARFVVYHEIAHAIVYQKELPIFGQEEQAADVGAVLMVERFHEREAATQIVQAASDMLLRWAADEEGQLELWTAHRVSLQRYYSILCVFFGGDTSQRGPLVEAAQLPDDRRETCIEEYARADHSWGNVLTDLLPFEQSESFILRVLTDQAPLLEEMLRDEVPLLNDVILMPDPIEIELRVCVWPDAFFDPGLNKITICSQFERALKSTFAP